MLSLTYCGIDKDAAQAIFEILIYTKSALEEVNLSGNFLGNEGVCRVLIGASVAKSLKKLVLADNQFQDDEDWLKSLRFCMEKNQKLTKYDFRYNNITDNGLAKITEHLSDTCQHVTGFEIPPRIEDPEIFTAFDAQLKANVKAGKKGKKKGKGKKKK